MATYVLNMIFIKIGSVLNVNDHIPWQPLDQNAENPSLHTKIQHMLITEDSELREIDTPNGRVHFRQVSNFQLMLLRHNVAIF